MKPILEHLLPEEEESFCVKKFDLSYFDTPLHYHPEFELVLIKKSKGKRFIGNVVSDFQEGDLTFIGSHLPHLFKNYAPYYDPSSNLRAQSIVIQFFKNFIGNDFWLLPQVKKFDAVFKKSQQGMDITGETKQRVVLKMETMLQVKGVERLICMLDILNLLADTTEYKLISDTDIITGHNAMDAHRLDTVFQYILENYQNVIRLEEVAGLVYMTRTSFCRYFQERTKRTFSDILAEIRLSQAAKLLVESPTSVSGICYECGYNNLSNFNRNFKKKYLITPHGYRKKYFNHKNDDTVKY
jgi:AraC-like DNA-binding protein